LEELNDAFLRLVLSLSKTENQLQLGLLTKKGVINYDLDRFSTLLVATQIALQGKVEEFLKYYTLINPLAPQADFVKKALTTNLPTISGLDLSNTIIITSLTKNSNRFLRTIQKTNTTMTKLLIPTKPWIWQNNLKKAHNVYESQIKLIKRLEENGINVYYSLNDILDFSKKYLTHEAMLRY
jgi:hypothetical protein